MNIKKMMEQAQQMQQKIQEETAALQIEASSGGGMVTAVVSGNKELLELRLEPDVVNPDDVEMLQDLIIAAVNEASRKADEALQEKLGGMMGGMGLNIPGL
ncbi:MAG: YbaB/EbfC family nucleoid-associated protein [Acidobacteria bacterium]|nr:YbaB/EbfC family nucleoid-associated protein [Acidobacteriota bacterium]